MIRNLRQAVRRPHTPTVDLSHPARSPLGSAVVNCVVYLDGERQRTATARPRRRCGGSVSRATASSGSACTSRPQEEFAGLAELFGLHPLAVEDAVHAHQRPKVERYDDTLFAVFKTVRYVEHDELTATSEVVETGEIMVFTGPDFVITVRHGGHGSLGPLREDAGGRTRSSWPRARPPCCTPSPTTSSTTTSPSPTPCRTTSTPSETDVFSEPAAGGDAGRIYQLKRELLELKRAVAPLGRPLQQLATQPMPLDRPRTSARTSATSPTTWPGSPSRSPPSTTCSTRSSRPTSPR